MYITFIITAVFCFQYFNEAGSKNNDDALNSETHMNDAFKEGLLEHY